MTIYLFAQELGVSVAEAVAYARRTGMHPYGYTASHSTHLSQFEMCKMAVHFLSK